MLRPRQRRVGHRLLHRQHSPRRGRWQQDRHAAFFAGANSEMLRLLGFQLLVQKTDAMRPAGRGHPQSGDVVLRQLGETLVDDLAGAKAAHPMIEVRGSVM